MVRGSELQAWQGEAMQTVDAIDARSCSVQCAHCLCLPTIFPGNSLISPALACGSRSIVGLHWAPQGAVRYSVKWNFFSCPFSKIEFP